MIFPSIFSLIALAHGANAFEALLGYQPVSDVRDHAAIDLDHVYIARLLQEAKLDEAKHVYQKGSFSRSFAELTFGFEGLPADIQAHSPVSGMTESGEVVKGMMFRHGKIGEKTVPILYNNIDNPNKCYVGGNPEPDTSGCFASAGKISFDHLNAAVPYSYNVLHSNQNDRVLSWISTNAHDTMRPCGKCELFTNFGRFYRFYGKLDFAHRWIMAAFTGARTVFDSSAVDFKGFGIEARSAALEKVMVTMLMFHQVIRDMEDSIHECKRSCTKDGCTEKAAHIVDMAAAFYIGSLEDAKGGGKLLYSVADEECTYFKTCGANNDATKGTSKVNLDILDGFQGMQLNATNRACSEARHHKDIITNNMKIPLIQGTLRYAYMRANKKDLTDIDKALGAAYTASIVPLVAACGYKDAEIIEDNMETTSKGTDFTMVKEAFERHYNCLGVSCQSVGGLWDEHGKTYQDGADPCTFQLVGVSMEEEDNSTNNKKKFGWGFGVPLVVLAVGLIVWRRKQSKRRKKKKKRHAGDIIFDDDSDSDSEFESRFI